jgi:hypothetical protein
MNKNNFLEKYKQNTTAIWIRCKLTNGEELNLDKHKGWTDLKEKCEEENLYFSELYLQYKSHQEVIDTKDSDGIYIIKSVMGQMGGETRSYYTTGVVKGLKVDKKMWITPELVVDKEYEDEIENCFEEAIIYDKTKENREK